MAGHTAVVGTVADFEAVVAQVYAPLQRYLRRRTDPARADDVLGDVLLILWRRCDDIPADAALAWSYGVARRCLANSRRGSERQLRLARRLAEEPPPTAAADDPILDEALSALPERDREVLRLWAWEQLPAQQIALALGVTPNAASIRLHRAKARLRKELARRKDPGPTGHLAQRQGKEDVDERA